jgi:hypothetical protein
MLTAYVIISFCIGIPIGVALIAFDCTVDSKRYCNPLRRWYMDTTFIGRSVQVWTVIGAISGLLAPLAPIILFGGIVIASLWHVINNGVQRVVELMTAYLSQGENE